jgi:hypothetical protein
MHPIERLRLVARAGAEGRSSLLAREAATALAMFSDDPAGLVTACRRLVDRHPTSGPMWWLAARVLVSADPAGDAWRSSEELDDDPTASVLSACIADDSIVTVLGWPEQSAAALVARGDVQSRVVDALGDGAGLVRRLDAAGSESALVPESGLGSAVATSDLLLIDVGAMGDDGLVAVTGAHAAAAVARHAGVAVWAVAGLGCVLPRSLWKALRSELDGSPEPWEDVEEIVPIDLVDAVVRPSGLERVADAVSKPDCGLAPELLRRVS